MFFVPVLSVPVDMGSGITNAVARNELLKCEWLNKIIHPGLLYFWSSTDVYELNHVC